jgi:hypothetical protein
MVNVLTAGAVKQREVTDPITTCCDAEQSLYVRILVQRLAAGTSPWRAFARGRNPAPPYPRQMV